MRCITQRCQPAWVADESHTGARARFLPKDLCDVSRRFRVAVVVLAVAVAGALALGAASGTFAGKQLCGHQNCGAATAAATAPWGVRGLYISWGCCQAEHAKAASLGFNAVSVAADRDRLDYIRSLGLKGLVWLGGFDNSTCSFVYSDAEVRTKVEAIAGHPAILGYEIDNEPHAYECSSAPRQIRHRVALVRSLVGSKVILYITLSQDFAAFANSGVDLIRISAYPCSYQYGCVMQKIADKVAAARAAGFTRIWGGSQTAGDSYYRPPTPAELAQIQQTWRNQGAEGYVAWAWDGHGTTDPLRTNTALQDAWKIENTK